jgi:hypothetical protein
MMLITRITKQINIDTVSVASDRQRGRDGARLTERQGNAIANIADRRPLD